MQYEYKRNIDEFLMIEVEFSVFGIKIWRVYPSIVLPKQAHLGPF